MDTFACSCPNVDKPELQQAISVILTQYDIKPALISTGHPDLRQKIKLFLSGKKLEGIATSTYEGYTNELRIFAEHVPKSTEDITTADIRVYLAECGHLKTSSLSKRLSVLKSMFGWLVNEDILTRDPTKRIKPPKKEQRMPKALSIEELEMIREACITPRERAMIEVLYCIGGRLSEIQTMNRDDIDWQSLSVLVIGKGNKERPVYFSFKAAYHLKKYLKLRVDSDPALFVSERRPYRRLSDRGIERVG